MMIAFYHVKEIVTILTGSVIREKTLNNILIGVQHLIRIPFLLLYQYFNGFHA